MQTAQHTPRIRIPQHRLARRAACRPHAPARLYDRLYTGLVEPDGIWTLYADATPMLITNGQHSSRILATAMLCDAFPGSAIRPDLIDAFLTAWDPPDDSGFVLEAELVAGWSLRWALEHPAGT